MSTNFRLEFIEPSGRERYFYLWTPVEREERGASEERSEHGSNLARLETASELKKPLTFILHANKPIDRLADGYEVSCGSDSSNNPEYLLGGRKTLRSLKKFSDNRNLLAW